jgi:hypothetical protein
MKSTRPALDGPAGKLLLLISATFDRFAELDQPVSVRARPLDGGPTSDGQVTVAIECHQDGQMIATVQLTYAPIS